MPERTTQTKQAGNVIITSVDTADVRRSFFEDFAPIGSDRQWWWPTDVFINPQAVIAVDEDTDDLHYVEYEVKKNDTISWKEPVAAKNQIVAVDGGKVLAGAQATPVTTFKTAVDVRPADRTRTMTEEEPVPEGTKDKTETATAEIEVPALRERLGLSEDQLPDDATPEQIDEALALPQSSGDSTTQSGEDEELETDDDDGKTVTVSKEVFDEMSTRLVNLETKETERDKTEAKKRRDGVVESAVTSGRIAPSEREYYRGLLDIDEKKTAEKLSSLAANKVPLKERGANPAEEQVRTQGTGLLPELRRKEATA